MRNLPLREARGESPLPPSLSLFPLVSRSDASATKCIASFFGNAAALYIPRAYIHSRDPQTDHLGIQFAGTDNSPQFRRQFRRTNIEVDRLRPYSRIRLFLSVRSFIDDGLRVL